MPHIDSTKFGEITIDGGNYKQVLIVGDLVMERDYQKLESLFGTTHKIGNWEIEELIGNNPEIIIIGTGQNGVMEVNDKFLEIMERKNIKVITEITPKAIEIYNKKVEENKKINALIHTTC